MAVMPFRQSVKLRNRIKRDNRDCHYVGKYEEKP